MQTSELYKRLNDAIDFLKVYACKFTSDDYRRKELLQETLLKILLHPESYRNDVNFNGWLAVIMRNTYLNMMHEKDCCIIGYDFCDDYCNKHSYNDSALEFKELKKEISSLPRELYIPFNLFVDGYRYCEIAEELSLPLGTIKSRIHSARERLSRLLMDF